MAMLGYSAIIMIFVVLDSIGTSYIYSHIIIKTYPMSNPSNYSIFHAHLPLMYPLLYQSQALHPFPIAPSTLPFTLHHSHPTNTPHLLSDQCSITIITVLLAPSHPTF